MNIKQIEQLKEKEEAITYLKELITDDNLTVYTILKHVSSSGMMRHIDVIYIKNNIPHNINWYIEKIGTYKRASNYNAKNEDSLRVRGSGMDMGFHVVYGLSCQLFGTEHENVYKLKQEWL